MFPNPFHMAAQNTGTGKQTPNPNTARPSVRDLIKDAENRHAKLDRIARVRAAKARHWQKRKKTHARIFGTVPRCEYDAIAKRAIAQGRFRRRKDGSLQANVFEQVISEARCYQTQIFLPPKDIEHLINRLFVQLRKIGTNLNQIARQTNIFGQRAADKTQIQKLTITLEKTLQAFIARPWRKDEDERRG